MRQARARTTFALSGNGQRDDQEPCGLHLVGGRPAAGRLTQSEYGKVVLPLTVLRRFDCVLAPVRADMLAQYERLLGKVENFAPILDQLTDTDGLWNTSRFDIAKLLDDPDNIADNLCAYIAGFSDEAREVLGMHTHDSPDFVTFGLPTSKVSAVVDPVCERAMRNSPVPIGKEHRTQLAHGAIVSLVPVPDAWVGYDPGRVGAWFDLFAPRFPSFVQIFWADEAGRMPWEPACNPAVAVMQPLLFEDPLSVPTQADSAS